MRTLNLYLDDLEMQCKAQQKKNGIGFFAFLTNEETIVRIELKIKKQFQNKFESTINSILNLLSFA